MTHKLLRFVFFSELLLCSYIFVSEYLYAAPPPPPPPPPCSQCGCKMTYSWMFATNATANGCQTQANPPQKVLQAVIVLEGVLCPDPPHIAQDGNNMYDSYTYQNPTLTCKVVNQNDLQEADVAGAGTRYQIGTQAWKCVP